MSTNTHLKSSDYKKMPWKNGRGITTELAIFPPGSSLQANDFTWRLSSADINEDGPFSLFPGCQRYLAVLEGTGVDLSSAARTTQLDTGSLINFSAEEQFFCRLKVGPVKDLNLIYKRDLVDVAGQVLHQPTKQMPLTSGTHIFFAASGAVELSSQTTGTVKIGNFETLLITLSENEAATVTITPESNAQCFYFHLV